MAEEAYASRLTGKDREGILIGAFFVEANRIGADPACMVLVVARLGELLANRDVVEILGKVNALR